MFKSTVAIASLLAGSAAAGAAVYVQSNGHAFTSAAPAAYWTPNPYARPFDPLRATYVEIEVPAESTAADEPAILPERVSQRAVAARLRSKRRGAALAPCSAWRDIGVKAVAGPTGPEPRNVRALCK